jgi:hypothetical protein
LPPSAHEAESWNDLVVTPVERALAAGDQRIAALFQYREAADSTKDTSHASRL